MNYTELLSEALFIRRYNRFFADVETASGGLLTLHCPNTGSMKNCLVPRSPCWYSRSDKPSRKLPGTLEQVTTTFGNRAGINTALPNKIVREALSENLIPALSDYPLIRSEVPYGDENSRIDLLLTGSQRDCYVEVKSVTLDMGSGLALFPDAVTSRGCKHLRELMAMAASGQRAVLFYCVQLSDVDRVSIASDIDPEYAQTLTKAVALGVEVMAWQCLLTPSGVSLLRPLELIV